MLRWKSAPRAAAGAGLAIAGVLVALSGGSRSDPQTPPALPGMPAPFLGVATIGDGKLTAAVDAYGSIVEMRAPGPAGRALIENPHERQTAGSVPPGTGIVLRVSTGGGPMLPLWRMDSVRQRYVRDTNVLRTVGRGNGTRIEITDAIRGNTFARVVDARGTRGAPLAVTMQANTRQEDGAESWTVRERGHLRFGVVATPGNGRALNIVRARGIASRIVRDAAAADRRWLARAKGLGTEAPDWARRMHRRSLLVLRALTDRRTGAAAAGVRDGWAYVWPRDAGAVALALAATGYRPEARRVARFLLGLNLESAARFRGTGAPVTGRAAQGDAWGWVAAAAQATGLRVPRRKPDWQAQADYQERDEGSYLGNAIASGAAARAGRLFQTQRGLVREASDSDPRDETESNPGRGSVDSDSGLDSAAAWAVRPFPQPALFPSVRSTLLRLAAGGGRFGIVPSEDWPDEDPWTAPTAWTVWSLAALGERRAALRLMAALRRAATPAGVLPERVDADTGIPRSTTPLAWSHAFAILALRELWPRRARSYAPHGYRTSSTSR